MGIPHVMKTELQWIQTLHGMAALMVLMVVGVRIGMTSPYFDRVEIMRAVVKEVPMDAVYADEESHLKAGKVLPVFLRKHTSRLWRRYVYSYLVRDFNVGSVYSLVGLALLAFGLLFGLDGWINGVQHAAPVTSGTVMLAALPVIIGIQCWIAFLHHDVSNVPIDPLSRLLDEAE